MTAERGDLTRVANPRHRRKCLGLIPSESSTGERRHQGSLTQAGYSHTRRALVEGAWASRYGAHVRRHLQRRLEQQPQAIQDIRWKAQVRLGNRSRRVMARGQPANQVVGAMARERVGCRWAMAA
jgi:transposase